MIKVFSQGSFYINIYTVQISTKIRSQSYFKVHPCLLVTAYERTVLLTEADLLHNQSKTVVHRFYVLKR